MLWIAVHGLQRWAFRRGPQARLAARMDAETDGPLQGFPGQGLNQGKWRQSTTETFVPCELLKGLLPDALCDVIPGLAALEVSRNSLGALPADLGLCAQLASVRAARNQLRELSFVGSILPRLTELNADHNAIGQVPPALWLCPSLAHVSLCANGLTFNALNMPPSGRGVRAAPLEHLDLGENRLGALPPLGLYPRLREVHVQQNGLRELPLEQLAPLQLLQTLDVSMNDVSQLPPQLALLPRLQNLTIVGNPIRSIPQSVQQRGATAVLDLLKKRCPDP